MSVVIQNVTPRDWPKGKKDEYVVKINQRIICHFSHTRHHDGLAQCLRDAAVAVDKAKT